MTRLHLQNPELAQFSSSIFEFSILVDKSYSQTLKISVYLSCWKKLVSRDKLDDIYGISSVKLVN